MALSFTGALTSVLLVTPSATATPSCVAQSVQAEHEIYGTAWGHDVVAILASRPEALQDLGFESFGDLASYAALQDGHCPSTNAFIAESRRGVRNTP